MNAPRGTNASTQHDMHIKSDNKYKKEIVRLNNKPTLVQPRTYLPIRMIGTPDQGQRASTSLASRTEGWSSSTKTPPFVLSEIAGMWYDKANTLVHSGSYIPNCVRIEGKVIKGLEIAYDFEEPGVIVRNSDGFDSKENAKVYQPANSAPWVRPYKISASKGTILANPFYVHMASTDGGYDMEQKFPSYSEAVRMSEYKYEGKTYHQVQFQFVNLMGTIYDPVLRFAVNAEELGTEYDLESIFGPNSNPNDRTIELGAGVQITESDVISRENVIAVVQWQNVHDVSTEMTIGVLLDMMRYEGSISAEAYKKCTEDTTVQSNIVRMLSRYQAIAPICGNDTIGTGHCTHFYLCTVPKFIVQYFIYKGGYVNVVQRDQRSRCVPMYDKARLSQESYDVSRCDILMSLGRTMCTGTCVNGFEEKLIGVLEKAVEMACALGTL